MNVIIDVGYLQYMLFAKTATHILWFLIYIEIKQMIRCMKMNFEFSFCFFMIIFIKPKFTMWHSGYNDTWIEFLKKM